MVIGGFAASLVQFRGQLLRDMVRMGHEVFACAPESPASVAQDLAEMGIGYLSLPMRRTGKNPFHDVYSLISFVKLFRRMKPNVVLSYTIKPSIYGSMGASVANVNMISSMITGLGTSFSSATPAEIFLRQVVKLLYRTGLRRNHVVFFQNQDDLRLFLNDGIVGHDNNPTLINGSGVDLDYYDVRPLPAMPRFLLVARLIREKGVLEYAEAARVIRSRHPQAEFMLAGIIDRGRRGIPADDLQRWHDEGSIRYLGALKDVRPAIADASVCVLPSYYGEGVPRSVLEAMSMGRAVITTDAPGCRETVRPGVNGFLVPVRDISALADAMEKFLVEPPLSVSMGAASRMLAEEKFNVHDVNRIILEKLELWNEAPV